ncbi:MULTISPECIES: DUF1292 domain-containing protein [Cytobacillus]|uniref:DUF1292 domain-containing protein n=1 Tax=Cytobacillus TaxID=2675230 RepID=UPI00207A4E16|nr:MULTISPECIES: DUF1292 domain-containing protein [Cytobacillus]MED3554094.1 DUF1292 domain-containing protein [Cytobacillus praedii]MED3576015.1 DUF1292 domain-containing protein [Cytobacillus praedii]USK57777.1 DUF1292 domain-containing protein [Cytobacillus solani]
MSQNIELILQDEKSDLTIDDVSLKQMIVVNGKRYAVLQVSDDISFANIVIDNEGNTGFKDIEDEREFDNVKSFYKLHK